MTKYSPEIEVLQDVLVNQAIAEKQGTRDPEFDLLMKRLEFHRLPAFQKVIRSIYIIIGVGLGLLLLLAIIM
jgi:hypothetical protein